MINKLEGYCRMWNLRIVLMKSKIIVFLNGGRLQKFERWSFEGNPIEVVNEYKYLGVTITPRLALGRHFSERVSHAKFGLNSALHNFMKHKNVPNTSKLEVYKSVSRTVFFYAGQAWDFQQYDVLEKFKRYFIKKLQYLPRYTPTYILALETDITSILTLEAPHQKFKIFLHRLFCRPFSISDHMVSIQ